MSYLVLNAGSSSLKFGLFDQDTLEELCSGRVEEIGTGAPGELVIHRTAEPAVTQEIQCTDHPSALNLILTTVHKQARKEISAIGQRVVHGGQELTCPVLVDEEVMTRLDRLSELAPLHNPPALSVIRAVQTALPEIPQVAVFDTAFFSSLPLHEQVYPVPYDWYTEHGIRRFGFHGISHAYCSMRTAEFLGRSLKELRLVTCHLGNGCSASAIKQGTPVATTMGYTPLEGLMMGTRSGSVDPGILLHVQRSLGLSVDELDRVLQKKSGLLGVSGVSSDFRLVEEAAETGNDQAKLAIDIYASRIQSVIGSLTARMGGMDVLVFTAGVGEHSGLLRARVCEGLECLGVQLDQELNRTSRTDADVAREDSPVRILMIKTREDWMIARETRQLIRGG